MTDTQENPEPVDPEATSTDGPTTDPIATVKPLKVRRRPRRRWWLIGGATLVVIVLLVVIGGVVAELRVRSAIKGCAQRAVEEEVGAKPQVKLPGGLLVVNAFDQHLPWIQLDTPDNDGSESSVHARLTDVRKNGTIGSLKATAVFGYDIIKQSIADRITESKQDNPNSLLGGFTLEDVTGDPTTGEVTVTGTYALLGAFGVPATIVAKPKIENGKPAVEFTKATAVIDLPTSLPEQLLADEGGVNAMIPAGVRDLTYNTLQVTKDGFAVSVSGTNVTIGNSNASHCSLL